VFRHSFLIIFADNQTVGRRMNNRDKQTVATYPITVMLGNEMKDNMVHLGKNYNVLNGLAIDASPIYPSDKPFDIRHKGDMSLQWKVTKKGCKTKKGNNMFCMCCCCRGKDMYNPRKIHAHIVPNAQVIVLIQTAIITNLIGSKLNNTRNR
jgi:hypothetical protein